MTVTTALNLKLLETIASKLDKKIVGNIKTEIAWRIQKHVKFSKIDGILNFENSQKIPGKQPSG